MTSPERFVIPFLFLLGFAGCAEQRFASSRNPLPRSILNDRYSGWSDPYAMATSNQAFGRNETAGSVRFPKFPGQISIEPVQITSDAQNLISGQSVAQNSPQTDFRGRSLGEYQFSNRRRTVGPVQPQVRQQRAGQSTGTDLFSRIVTIQQELANTFPERMEEFVTAYQQASTKGNLDQVLAAWKAEIAWRAEIELRKWSATNDRPNPYDSSAYAQEYQDFSPESYSQQGIHHNVQDGEPQFPGQNVPPGVQSDGRIRYPDDLENASGLAVREGNAVPESSLAPTMAWPMASQERPGEPRPLVFPQDDQVPNSPRAVEERIEDPTLRTATSSFLDEAATSQLRQLAFEFENAIPENENEELKQQVFSRLLYQMAGEESRALRPIRAVERVDKNFWKNQLWVIKEYFDTKENPRPESRANEIVSTLEESIGILQQRADLEITTPIFCQKVDSFGNYTEFPNNQFKAGQQVIVYWEVHNFTALPDKDGYRTHIDATFEIYDSLGNKRTTPFSIPEDLCRNRRHDFFMNILYKLPSDLSMGEYVLKVIAHDKTSNKVAEKIRRFQIK